MSAMLEVSAVGPGVSLQDNGRPGYQRFGITEGGVMDRWALVEANVLLDNSPETAALEMIGTGGSFTVSGAAVKMATSGAPMDLTVDGVSIPWRSSFVVEPGQSVQCGYAKQSIYSYLQVEGGFALEPVMGSFSTHSRSNFGGFKGRVLKDGDALPVSVRASGNTSSVMLPTPEYLNTAQIRIVWGTQAEVFSAEVREALLNSEFSVTAERDRMGARLATEAGSLAAETGLSGVSDCVIIGDIQVAGDGVATVLLADRQPTGGYPRIATVITADLDAMSQMPTGKSFRFTVVSTVEAVELLQARQQELNTLASKVVSVTRRPEDIPDLLSYNLVDGVVRAR